MRRTQQTAPGSGTYSPQQQQQLQQQHSSRPINRLGSSLRSSTSPTGSNNNNNNIAGSRGFSPVGSTGGSLTSVQTLNFPENPALDVGDLDTTRSRFSGITPQGIVPLSTVLGREIEKEDEEKFQTYLEGLQADFEMKADALRKEDIQRLRAEMTSGLSNTQIELKKMKDQYESEFNARKRELEDRYNAQRLEMETAQTERAVNQRKAMDELKARMEDEFSMKKAELEKTIQTERCNLELREQELRKQLENERAEILASSDQHANQLIENYKNMALDAQKELAEARREFNRKITELEQRHAEEKKQMNEEYFNNAEKKITDHKEAAALSIEK